MGPTQAGPLEQAGGAAKEREPCGWQVLHPNSWFLFLLFLKYRVAMWAGSWSTTEQPSSGRLQELGGRVFIGYVATWFAPPVGRGSEQGELGCCQTAELRLTAFESVRQCQGQAVAAREHRGVGVLRPFKWL